MPVNRFLNSLNFVSGFSLKASEFQQQPKGANKLVSDLSLKDKALSRSSMVHDKSLKMPNTHSNRLRNGPREAGCVAHAKEIS